MTHYCKFIGECANEKTFETDQYLIKLRQKLGGVVFLTHCVDAVKRLTTLES